ncbi:unnamed protein product [Effrenium voratum]|nr:unnamed protein product [Effrenium voratum]
MGGRRGKLRESAASRPRRELDSPGTWIRMSCRRASKRLKFLGALRGVVDLWGLCCDVFRFDVFGHRAVCFKHASTWEVRFCCGELQEEWRFGAWLQRAITARPRLRVEWERMSRVPDFGLVSYHKTGTFVATQLLGYNEAPGPLAALLLGDSSRAFEYNLATENETAVVYDSEVECTRTWMRESKWGRVALLYNPLEHEVQQRAQLPRRLLHFVRRPSEVIISSYLYHLKRPPFEYWMYQTNPPDCHHCDFEAWRSVFAPCNFSCSFSERLRKLPLAEALELEIWRGRWTITKMLMNMNRWQASPQVLTMRATEFQANLTAALRRVAEFFLPTRPALGARPVRRGGLRLLWGARNFGLDLGHARSQCGQGLCSWALRLALNHSAGGASGAGWEANLRRRARAVLPTLKLWQEVIAPADAFYDRLMAEL